jgi:hypothetical protein
MRLTQKEVHDLLDSTAPDLKTNIQKMHSIYKLPTNELVTLNVGEPVADRLQKFALTLQDEINEVSDIIHKVNSGVGEDEIITDIADWLADLTIYVRSEAMKYGIDLETVTRLVMASNFTKVGKEPKYDERGKVLKDLSLFVPPEAAILAALCGNGSCESA